VTRSTVNQTVQVGLETTPGVAVPANRRLGSLSLALSPASENSVFRPKGTKYPTVVAANQEWAEGDVEGQPTYDEIVVPLSSVFTQAVVAEVMDGATATGAFQWTFSPNSTGADTPRTFTVEEGDAATAERVNHVLITEFGLEISRSEISMSGSAIGQRAEAGVTMTANPTAYADELVPILPGQVSLFVAEDPADLGTEDSRQATVLSANPSIGGRFNPVWYLNALKPSFSSYVEAPEPDFTMEYMVEADDAGMAWVDRFRNGRTMFVRIAAEGPVIYEGATADDDVRYALAWDFAVKVSEPGEKSDEDGVYAIQPTLQVVHDAAWGRATQITVTNTVAAL